MAQNGSVSSPEEKLDLIKRNLQVCLSKDDITEILLKRASC
jgi:nitroimidazol reductase NimA-like FMN-containing flavoprotein (pyridoxamine 5'-phosphate oxidase superfamily)